MYKANCRIVGVPNSFIRLFLTIFSVIILYALYIYSGSFPLEYMKTTCKIDIPKTPKVMLLWNQYLKTPHWYFQSSIVNIQCDVHECVITDDKNFLNALEEYDALVFHGAQLFEKPPNRDPKQLYVFSLREGPYGTPRSNSDNFYNMTMHYRFDSDVFWPNLQIVDRKTSKHVSPAYNPKWKNSSYIQYFVPSTSLIRQLKKKTKSVAWFVSHCETKSRREKLVKELQKYIQVDIYGKCGNLSCASNDETCNVILNRDYKFYLSFENSLCTDYVTEKFIRGLQHTVIPVVYGGGNYSRYAPPHSYINVEDFATVEELGKFLSNLEQNIDEYARYFWWKEFYFVRWYRTHTAFCDLCSQLNNRTRISTMQTYRSMEDHWFSVCRNATNIKF